MMELSELRIIIDNLDRELIMVLAKRMSYIPHVAEYKKKNNLPRYQPDREKQIIGSRRKLALEMGINPDLAEDIAKRIIEDAHRIEKEIIGI